jgi:hypothetical protein
MVPLAPGLVLIAPWVALLVLDVVGCPLAGFSCLVCRRVILWWVLAPLGRARTPSGCFWLFTCWNRVPSELSWLLSGWFSSALLLTCVVFAWLRLAAALFVKGVCESFQCSDVSLHFDDNRWTLNASLLYVVSTYACFDCFPAKPNSGAQPQSLAVQPSSCQQQNMAQQPSPAAEASRA